MEHRGLTFEGFVYRWISSVALVLGTYNPSEFCFINWVQRASPTELPYLMFVGALLLIGFVIVGRAAYRSLGGLGLGILMVLFTAGIWSLINAGWISVGEHNLMLYAMLISIATILAIGMSWSLFREEITGQVDVNT